MHIIRIASALGSEGEAGSGLGSRELPHKQPFPVPNCPTSPRGPWALMCLLVPVAAL